MNFQQAIESAFKNYFKFEGRASRSEFWLFNLFLFLVNLVFNVLYEIFNSLESGILMLLISLLSIGWLLFILIPSFSITIRRLHDTNRTGWWILITITIIGIIPYFIFLILKGTEGENRFGPDPLG